MITLYYSPNSCSLAVHLALELACVDYVAEKVQIGSPEFKAIAPKGAVPAMRDGNSQTMTQWPALLKYIANKFLDKNLGSDGTLEWQYEFDNAMAFVNSDLHTSFNSCYWAARFTTDGSEEAIANVKNASFARIERQLGFLEEMLEWKEFLVQNRLTVVDLYAYTVSRWGNFVLPNGLTKYPNILAHHARLEQMPEVQKVLAVHNPK